MCSFSAVVAQWNFAVTINCDTQQGKFNLGIPLPPNLNCVSQFIVTATGGQ